MGARDRYKIAAERVRSWPAGMPLAVLPGRDGPIIVLPLKQRRTPLHTILEPSDTEATHRIVCLPYELGAILEASWHQNEPRHPTSSMPLVIDVIIPPSSNHRSDHRNAATLSPPTPDRSDKQHRTQDPVLKPCEPRSAFIDAVRSIKDRIHDGDVYQVNLAHTLEGTWHGSTRELFARLLESAEPAFGAYVELSDGSVICSASPELYLDLDENARKITTRPMKGTRPLNADPDELRTSEKDRAELNMIVDLMRNDLGRIAAPGTVRVDRPRDIEPHAGGQLQATATISALLANGLTLIDVLRATFPPGSITGAPKIAAMRQISDHESCARGWYCGSIGSIDLRTGDAIFNVAIRTATLTRDGDSWRVRAPVGAGIVADSEPDAEWDETLLKAVAIDRALSGTTHNTQEANPRMAPSP